MSPSTITTAHGTSAREEVKVVMTIEDSHGFVHHYDLTTSADTIRTILQMLAS